MNAPTPGNIANIESFRELLPEGFIEETLERQARIQNNKNKSLASAQRLDNDLIDFKGEVNRLEEAFVEQGKLFNKLNSSCIAASKNMDDFAIKARELSDNMAKVAATIRNTTAKMQVKK